MNTNNKSDEATVMRVRTDLGMGGQDEIELVLVPVQREDIPWDGVVIELPDVSAETVEGQ